ncbi:MULTISPECIES: transposase, partial [Enterobacteriaceae]
PAYGPQNDVTLKMPAFEWVHVQLHQQKGMISLSPPTICNSALSEKVVIYYEKRGNAENYIKEAKYDMAVGHLLLKSFWANEAVFQMMMLSYNLFLLFKFDSLDSSEYRQQIKTFRLKYVFLAAKIIKTARYVIMKLSENYPYKGVYEKCLV